MAESIHEEARELPVIGEHDVVVVGGGVAGVAAAVSAARSGARTLLVENHCVLGGLATEGLIAIYLPICDGRGRQVMGGLAEEMLHLTRRHAPAQIPDCWQGGGVEQDRLSSRFMSRYAAHPYMIALEELVLAGGVRLAYDTRLCEAVCRGDRIEAIIVENKTGRCAIRGRTFVDASGDADLCARARQPTVAHRDNPRAAWFCAFDGSALQLVSTHVSFENTPPDEVCFAGDNHDDVTNMLIHSRPLIPECIARMRAERGNEGIYPAIISTIPEFRVTRRLAGEFELDSAHRHQWFEDAVTLAGDWRQPGPVYAVPYRSIVATTRSNLLVAGRCVSSTRSGAEITRVIPVCVATGEAAGTAAAMAAGSGIDLRRIDVTALQMRLRAKGVRLDQRLCAPPA
jgi:2-polyprenyl-6-methoxyphenol hydroxylase-like FAD-dependent oxidoreductase